MKKETKETISLIQGIVGLLLVGGGFWFKDPWVFALGAVLYIGAAIELVVHNTKGGSK